MPDKVEPDQVVHRVTRLTALVEELTAQRAEERRGELLTVLIETDDGEGRAAHQAPDVDGTTIVQGIGLRVGDLVAARVVGSEGVDLIADLVEIPVPVPT